MLKRTVFKIQKNFYHAVFKLFCKLHHVRYEKKIDINGFCFIRNNGSIIIGNDFHANSGMKNNPIGYDLVKLIALSGELIIGNGVGLSNCTIVATKKIEIGDNVAIGGGTVIIDSDFHSIELEDRIACKNVVSKSVIIDKGAFIGGYSKILKGVHIGENSIIGLGSVVTKDIPSNEIWAGNPAKFIRKLENNND